MKIFSTVVFALFVTTGCASKPNLLQQQQLHAKNYSNDFYIPEYHRAITLPSFNLDDVFHPIDHYAKETTPFVFNDSFCGLLFGGHYYDDPVTIQLTTIGFSEHWIPTHGTINKQLHFVFTQ
ncbi:MAG: hypothetical protein AAGH65_02235 [Pseudomonadota bacterium]